MPAVAFLRPLAVGLRGVFTPARELETDVLAGATPTFASPPLAELGTDE
jgi:hypothetical protein